MKLEYIKTSFIKDWILNIKDASVKSKKHYINVLSLILEFAKEDYCFNLAHAVKLPVYKKIKIIHFSSKEVCLILKSSKNIDKIFKFFLE